MSTETHKFTWRGRRIELTYNPRSFAGYAHLEIQSGKDRPLPITSTGYRSHFTPPADIEEMGGPVAYVSAWLDSFAQTKQWRRIERDGMQLPLL